LARLPCRAAFNVTLSIFLPASKLYLSTLTGYRKTFLGKFVPKLSRRTLLTPKEIEKPIAFISDSGQTVRSSQAQIGVRGGSAIEETPV
jgi:hypothetical protein